MCYVYLITCLQTGKYYVGKTSTTPQERFVRHWSSRYHKHSHLASALCKYGREAFIVECLVECDSAEIDNFERLWICVLDAANRRVGLNIKFGGEGGTIPPETREKIRQARKGWQPTSVTRMRMSLGQRNKIGVANSFYGHAHSIETRQHWSNIRQGVAPPNKGVRKPNARYNEPFKRCGKCFELKPQTTEFFYRQAGKRVHEFSSRCKDCTKAYIKGWKQRNRLVKK